jgi:hypothetical protein
MIEKYDLVVLPCRKLMILDFPYESEKFRIEIIKKWAEEDLFKFSIGFLFSKHNPDDFDDFIFPIGDVVQGRLVTSKEIILTISNQVKKLSLTYNESDLREHLEFYYKAMGMLPHWGENRYYQLLKDKLTPRVLQGPHTSGNLRPNQKRLAIPDKKGDLVFGPLLS